MQQVRRTKWVVLTLALCAVLCAGALVAQDHAAAAAGSGVTFVNNSHATIVVFARYGGDSGKCVHQPSETEVQIAAGSSGTVDSGSSDVCFCLDVPSRNACPSGWSTVKAGHKRVFQ